MSLDQIYKQIESYKDEAIKDLGEFIKIQSVSAKNEFLVEAADFCAKLLKKVGFKTTIHKTKGGPVVTGELNVGAKKTLMFYNHADVQPAEPFELWNSPPFELKIIGEKIYGRGVGDNKGEIIIRLYAIKAWLASKEKLPCNIKFIIETEEESSSKNFTDYVNKDTDFFKNTSGLIWEFGGSNAKGIQEFILGVKGILYVQLSVQKMIIDAHSANAPYLPNAAETLIQVFNLLKNDKGKILVPHFYDDIVEVSREEKELIKKFEMYPEEEKKMFGIQQFRYGLSDEEAKIDYFTKPTCNICGFGSGWQGVGGKTIIPKEAMMKIDFRLVKNQNPDKILTNLRKYLDENGFKDVKIDWHNGYQPMKTDFQDPFVKLCARVNMRVYKHNPSIQTTSGGSGPMFYLGQYMPIVSLGSGHKDSNAHAPNENVIIKDFINGMKMVATLIDEFKNY